MQIHKYNNILCPCSTLPIYQIIVLGKYQKGLNYSMNISRTSAVADMNASMKALQNSAQRKFFFA